MYAACPTVEPHSAVPPVAHVGSTTPWSTSGIRFWRTAATSGVIRTSLPHAPTSAVPLRWITRLAAPGTSGRASRPSRYQPPWLSPCNRKPVEKALTTVRCSVGSTDGGTDQSPPGSSVPGCRTPRTSVGSIHSTPARKEVCAASGRTVVRRTASPCGVDTTVCHWPSPGSGGRPAGGGGGGGGGGAAGEGGAGPRRVGDAARGEAAGRGLVQVVLARLEPGHDRSEPVVAAPLGEPGGHGVRPRPRQRVDQGGRGRDAEHDDDDRDRRQRPAQPRTAGQQVEPAAGRRGGRD